MNNLNIRTNRHNILRNLEEISVLMNTYKLLKDTNEGLTIKHMLNVKLAYLYDAMETLQKQVPSEMFIE